MPLINGHATCSRLKWERWCRRIDSELDLSRRRDNDLEDFLGDDAGAVEGVVEPEVGGERVVRRGGDDAVFEVVAGGETEDADGFDADVLIGGGVDNGGVGLIGGGAGEDVGFEAVAGFEELDLGGVLGLFGKNGFFGGLLGSLLGLRERKSRCEEKRCCNGEQEPEEAEMKSQDGLAGSLGRGWRHVKTWLRGRCAIRTAL